MQPSSNFAEINLEGTLSRRCREDTDVWQTCNLLTARKENAVNQARGGGQWIKKCENCNDLETVNHSWKKSVFKK